VTIEAPTGRAIRSLSHVEASTQGAGVAQRAPVLSVFYDASCALCRAEMGALAGEDANGLLDLVDCSAADFADAAALRSGITRDSMMRLMHVRDAQGNWHVGVDAFVAIYRTLGIETMARFWDHPWLKPMWKRAYPWIARYRQPLSRLGLNRGFELIVRRAASRAAMQRVRCDTAQGACERRMPGDSGR
jgi:predicted DCC family thiol-disulfide oxidoreductase YuxK